MEDLMDMDMSPLRPQNYLFNCELKVDKDYHFKFDNDENEHQLSLSTVSLGAGAKGDLHIVKAEPMNYEGSPIKVTLATLKMSVQSMVSIGGFEITPPLVLWLNCGSGPVHISGQHLVAVEENAESEDEEEEDVKLLSISGKSKGQESFKKQKKSPITPERPSSVEYIKAKMQASTEKGGSLPKVEAKFINYVKNCFQMTDQEAIQYLWQWWKSLEENSLNNLLKIFRLISFL
uniref:Nucleophosmin n=1 Tax=Macaca nemestrina TaxID=9545 RepID=A0A2K6CEW3_MACNE